MIYPQKLNSKDTGKLLKLLLIISSIIAVILTIINKLTSPNIPWAALANGGIIYIWIVVLYSIKRNTNIAGHVLLQMIIISMVVLHVDNTIGFYGWSISIAIPIILIVANIAMLILTIISYKKYIRYVISQLAIVIITLIFAGLVINDRNLLNISTMIVAIVNLTISLILSYKDIKEEIIRNFHM